MSTTAMVDLVDSDWTLLVDGKAGAFIQLHSGHSIRLWVASASPGAGVNGGLTLSQGEAEEATFALLEATDKVYGRAVDGAARVVVIATEAVAS